MIEGLARLLLRLLPSRSVVPVVRGPLRGYRWVVGSTRRGAVIGQLEASTLKWFVEAIAPGAMVWDLGAHVGLYTLAAARRAGRVIAFEPLPANVAALKRHLTLNGVTNVDVVEAAVGRTTGRGRLTQAASPSEVRLRDDGTIPVDVVSLDEWMRATATAPPAVIKIDVEGGELDVLNGGSEALAGRPTIILSVHSDELAASCLAWLTSRGYSVHGPAGEPPGETGEWIAIPRLN